MCLYTYHHYPLCGHISNWTVTSCLEFTSQLRLLHGTGNILCCNDVEVTHDLHPTAPYSLCTQCDFDWAEAMTSNDPDAFQAKIYRVIEGLDAKYPMIEFAVRMTVDVRNSSTRRSPSPSSANSQVDESAAFAGQFTPCHSSCCSCKGSGACSTSLAGVERELDQEGLRFTPTAGEEPKTGKPGTDVLPSPAALTADILQALAQGIPTEQDDCPAISSRSSNINPADAKIVNHALGIVKTNKAAPADPKILNFSPPENPSLHHVGRPRYSPVLDIDTASHGISGRLDEMGSRVQVQFEPSSIETSSPKISSTNYTEPDNATTHGHGSAKRPGTPYADMDIDKPRRFIAAASEQEARELGLSHPLRIGNLYAGF